MAAAKPFHTVVLDAGPIIRGDPDTSTLRAQSEEIVTVPMVITEIRDEATRARLQTTLLPFLVLRSPRESSIKLISDFARRTGDLAVLSKADVQLLALTYDIECERNGGDWRLRRAPGEKRTNGPKPDNIPSGSAETAQGPAATQDIKKVNEAPRSEGIPTETGSSQQGDFMPVQASPSVDEILKVAADLKINEQPDDADSDKAESHSEAESDSEGWITPSNLKKKQAADASGNTKEESEPKVLQAALVTSDYAMQNVALQMNLNLISTSLHRVRHVKTFVLRCHACFHVVKDTSKQFCPRCGKPTLTRVSCSTSATGEFKLHLKKNMQWNTRGDRYSIPKPVAGAANGRVKGGGKSGWGNELILAEDQKEYVRALEKEKRVRARDLMDEDYLPGILTGDRGGGGGRTKIGAGKNVNSRKRR